VKRILVVVLGLLALASLAWVAVPVYLIMPFSPQTPVGVEIAYALKSRAAVVTLLCLVAGLLTTILLWRRLRFWGRLPVCVAVLLLAGCAWFGRQNHFEWMFHPVPRPAFVTADCAHEVEDDDLVLAVTVNGEARAYPVRALAYHHVVNDVVGDEPIVVTY
jgi:uncharacterized protein DUF3179